MDKTKSHFQSQPNDSVTKTIHDIKNLKYFTAEKLKQINEMSPQDRLKILHSYNEMMNYYVDIINSM